MTDSLTQEALNQHPAVASLTEMVRLRYGARELSGFPKIQARQMLAGGHKSSFRGRGMDFDQVRLYQPGDDVRTIDWRVTARTQTPHTKIFSEERERPILVITDLRGPMAVIMGSEQYGLSDFWLQNADQPVRIPMAGQADSLNVAMATIITLFEAVRQRGQ